MRRELLAILRCPACRGTLALAVSEERAGEIVTGELRCTACGEAYPIENTVPILLPPPPPPEEKGPP